MAIRTYQPGDEQAQARVYNVAAGSLPGFKPATAEEIGRRYRGGDPDPESRYFAVENGEVVGYAVFGPNGRISYPWCLPGAENLRQPLLETVLREMRKRGIPEAWTAYRADWSPVHEFLDQHGFTEKRRMINYVADVSQLPVGDRLPANRVIEPLARADLPQLIAIANGLLAGSDPEALEQFYWNNRFTNLSESLLAFKDGDSGEILGVSLLVVNDQFADPTKIDAAMPCFRLGAFGTERERHKRVNGLFSCVFVDETEGERLLSASLRAQTQRSGPTAIAAQAPSDAPALCAWYDRFFQRQGSFPIWSRRL
jgi:GNAT superfamily N-acetyltransferase